MAAVVVAITLAVSACGGTDSDTTKSGDKRLEVAVPADASSLDPILGSAGGDHVMLYPIYETLISFDADMTPQPGLVEEWQQASPTELTLTLREGLTFHDGTALDAEAVKFNLERARDEGSNVAVDLAAVKTIRVEDPRTVTLLLSEPDASLLMALSDRAGMMVSPAAVEASDGDVSNNPVGSGGWSYVEWNRGQSLRVERFEDYWNADAARVQEIQFNVVADPTTRATSLRSGQQHIALSYPAAAASTVGDDSDLQLERTPRLWVDQVYFNTAAPELNDPRVRRALNLAIDREAIVKSAYFELGSPASSLFPSDYWAAAPEDVVYDFDQDEARSLLAEAGASDLTFDMLLSADAGSVRMAEIIQQQWADIGVTVELQPREGVQAVNAYFTDHAAPALLSAFTGRPDPKMAYDVVFSEESFYNTSGEPTPGLEAALEQTDESVEIPDRVEGFQAAARAVYDHSAFLPLCFPDNLIGLSSEVSGFQDNLLGKPKFLGVTLS
ncbi:ABC transporter substrate-binding protein (plasmid) [Georgenia sp. TF02-10]|uniref:ABC transporter substrate-binding protein n=1 Tax=Georgenia sp. TF02-10 TaxID=2917725 RepID=UPI001FA6EB82|nr:ABC transporter substrate-binding protein [Georgenia sp. TF02-10]UNX56610.1 ABC transporter substrate-binding protein [Georgenia sp. TF02-10]